MSYQRNILLGILFVATAALAAWPVRSYYEPNSDGVNAANIQRMGYGAVLKVGKVYEFKFKGGKTAWFARISKRSSLQFAEVGKSDYLENPGEDGPSEQRNGRPSGGGAGAGGERQSDSSGGYGTYPGQRLPSGRRGTVSCEPACFG